MRISVIITGFNCEQYAKQCIDSVINQTKKAHEILVWNDASTDRTKEILDSYGEQIDCFHASVNTGALFARHKMISVSSADVVCFLGLDDLLTDDALEIVARYYSDPEVQMTWGGWQDIRGAKHEAQQYGDDVWKAKSFRRAAWKATALNTFKTELIKQVPDHVLKDETGSFFKNCTDLAYSFPCLEMLRKEETRVISETVYIYRSQHENTTLKRLGRADKIRVREQLKRIKSL